MEKQTKPKQLNLKVKRIEKINPGIFLFCFDDSFLAKNSRPGQFLHIKIDKVILRRPFSIHYVKGDTIYILFRIRGRGTKVLSEYKPGKRLNIIGPLGNGFGYAQHTTQDARRILIAGGLGVAPLVFLAQELKKIPNTQYPIRDTILLGAKRKEEILCETEFKKLGCKVYVATEDGSKGTKGTVIDLLNKLLRTTHNVQRTTAYSCGPEEMFFQIHKVLKTRPGINCQVSFEQFMGCGLGVCCACTIKTKHGYKKVCKDGPVFNIKDIW